MHSLDDLIALVDAQPSGSALADTNFQETFRSLHHFAAPGSGSRPERFSVFVDYCKRRQRGIDPGGTNERTIQRAYRYVELAAAGATHEEAAAQAWLDFPKEAA